MRPISSLPPVYDTPRRSARPRAGGFTLIELLVVVAILGLLVSIMLPSLQHAKELARRAVCGSNLHHVGLALQGYASQDRRNHFPPSPEWMNASNTMEVYSLNNSDRDYEKTFTLAKDGVIGGRIGYNDPWIGLGLLMDLGLLDAPEAMYCPAIDESPYLSYPAGWDFPAVWGAQKWRLIGYFYRIFGQPRGNNITKENILELFRLEANSEEALLADVFLDCWRRGPTQHPEPVYGVNVAFADGRAEFVELGDYERRRADRHATRGGLGSGRYDQYVYLYMRALGTRDFEPLDDAGFFVPP